MNWYETFLAIGNASVFVLDDSSLYLTCKRCELRESYLKRAFYAEPGLCTACEDSKPIPTEDE